MKEYSYIKKALLRELGENSRTPVTALAKKLKCSRNTIMSNIKALEKEFGLKYTLQLNKEKIGLIQNQILVVKFGIKPKLEDINHLFDNDDFLQLVAMTKGDFDLLMVRKVPANMVTDNGQKYTHWALKTTLKLLEYRPTYEYAVPVLTHIGFTPILNETITKLDLKAFGMDELDKKILMQLNGNSRLSYKALSRKLGTDVETIRYRFRMLSKKNIILKFTTIITKPPTEYNMAFLVNYELSPGIIRRYNEACSYYIGINEGLRIINPIQYLGIITGNHLLLGIGCFENEESAIKNIITAQKESYKSGNQSVIYARITNVIRGFLPISNVEVKSNFKALNWQ